MIYRKEKGYSGRRVRVIRKEGRWQAARSNQVFKVDAPEFQYRGRKKKSETRDAKGKREVSWDETRCVEALGGRRVLALHKIGVARRGSQTCSLADRSRTTHNTETINFYCLARIERGLFSASERQSSREHSRAEESRLPVRERDYCIRLTSLTLESMAIQGAARLANHLINFARF